MKPHLFYLKMNCENCYTLIIVHDLQIRAQEKKGEKDWLNKNRFYFKRAK